jgi:hypothetical protein
MLNPNLGRAALAERFAWFTVQTTGAPGASEWLDTNSADADALVEY